MGDRPTNDKRSISLDVEGNDLTVNEVERSPLGRSGRDRRVEASISLDEEVRGLNVHTEVRREDARTRISLIIVGSLAGIVVGSFLSLWSAWYFGHAIDDVVKMTEALLSPVIGIVGAVTGFYFGGKQREALSPDR